MLEKLDNGIIHSSGEDGEGWSEKKSDGMRFHLATQNDAQFNTYKLFMSGNFHVIFSDCI